MSHPSVALAMPRNHAVGDAMRRYGVYVAIAAILLYNLFFTHNFFEINNIRTQLVQVVPVLIVALGMALVIGTGGVDLSVGAVMALAAAVIPLYIGYGVLPTCLVVIVVGIVAGAVNGTMVAGIGVQPIVATLSLMTAGRGLALLAAHEQLKPIMSQGLLQIGRGALFDSSALRIPYAVIIALALVVAMAILVNRTTFGKQVLAIGGNRQAAELAGLPVKRALVCVYITCAALASIAGIIATARLGASVPSTIGNLMELSAITSVVVGGTPLSGGKVKVGGTVAGALLLQLITATLVKHDVPDAYSQIAQACIILGAVYLQRERLFH